MIDQDKIDRVVERLITKIESSNTYILNEIAKSINEMNIITNLDTTSRKSTYLDGLIEFIRNME